MQTAKRLLVSSFVALVVSALSVATLSVATLSVAALSVANRAVAQQQFDPLLGRHLPTQNLKSTRLTFADVDGDFDLDLVVPLLGGVPRLQRNDGAGVFTDVTATQFPPRVLFASAVVAGDVDGDGDADLVFSGQGPDGISLYRNDGASGFHDVTGPKVLGAIADLSAVVLVDVDGDNDLDLVGAHLSSPEQHRLFVNDGSGRFLDRTAATMPPPILNFQTRSVVAGDLDGDGDADLVFGGQLTRIFVNDGAGRFADMSAQRLPQPSLSSAATALALGDVDGDGDLDLHLAHNAQNELWRNDGSGTFVDDTAASLPLDVEMENAVLLRDFDGDGDLDLVNAGGLVDRFLRNAGNGVFIDTLSQFLPWRYDQTAGLAAGDVDGDGDLDLALGNTATYGAQNRLLLNDGVGTFRDVLHARVASWPFWTTLLASGDLDGDHDVDVVQSTSYMQFVRWRNDGTGRFRNSLLFGFVSPGEQRIGMQLADVDGDGDLDVLAWSNTWSNPPGRGRLLRNDGSGGFADVSASQLPNSGPALEAIVVGDFDGDGDVDLVGAGAGAGVHWRNTGAGSFTPATVPLPTTGATAVVAGDLDGDGDLDLVLGRAQQPSQLLQNTGNGVFVDTTGSNLIAASIPTRCLALGDVDGDGDLDLAVGSGENAPSQQLLYRNDGAWSFTDVTATQLPALLHRPAALAFRDLDEDGDLDLVVGGLGMPGLSGEPPVRDRVLVNDGSGTFTDVTVVRAPSDGHSTQAMLVDDFDGDGDFDLLLGKAEQDALWCNLRRQLAAPYVLRVGRPWTLEAHARYGPPGAIDVVLPWLSPTRTAIAVPPFGVLGIDPTTPLTPLVIAQPAGVATTTWTVPNTPALAGIAVHAQGLFLSSLGSVRLTNVVSDVVMP